MPTDTTETGDAVEPFELSKTDEFFHWVFQHWLTIINVLVLLYAGTPWLSPLLIWMGYTDLGMVLFRIYTPLCHQNPLNSPFFLGHQVAFCVRESAMYTALLLGGLIYAPLRHHLVKHPLDMRLAGLLLLPLVLDGTSQTIDAIMPAMELRGDNDAAWSFNWWTRIISGLTFAAAVVLAIYPRLDRDLRGMGES